MASIDNILRIPTKNKGPGKLKGRRKERERGHDG